MEFLKEMQALKASLGSEGGASDAEGEDAVVAQMVGIETGSDKT